MADTIFATIGHFGNGRAVWGDEPEIIAIIHQEGGRILEPDPLTIRTLFNGESVVFFVGKLDIKIFTEVRRLVRF